VNRVIEDVNRLEWTRKQLDDAARALAAAPDSSANAATRDSVMHVLHTATAVEEMFMDVHRPGGAEEFETPMKLYGRYLHLMTELDGSSDFEPTQPDVQVQGVLHSGLSSAEQRLEQLMQQEIPALNRVLARWNRPLIGLR
jgi:hypothetical protein